MQDLGQCDSEERSHVLRSNVCSQTAWQVSDTKRVCFPTVAPRDADLPIFRIPISSSARTQLFICSRLTASLAATTLRAPPPNIGALSQTRQCGRANVVRQIANIRAAGKFFWLALRPFDAKGKDALLLGDLRAPENQTTAYVIPLYPYLIEWVRLIARACRWTTITSTSCRRKQKRMARRAVAHMSASANLTSPTFYVRFICEVAAKRDTLQHLVQRSAICR
ncbi:hypothetical protein ACVJGD_008284 [Bradyrhizobium sp. USDA 10063]